MKQRSGHFLSSASMLAAIMAAPVFVGTSASAQPADTSNESDEIVVTGTSIRGIAPAGAETIGLDRTDVAATGATTTNQLLATIPQLNSFGTAPMVQGANNVQLTVNRTNIRNLPQGIGGAAPTLVLMDGHRLAGSGVSQTYPDPDVVPPGVIERVEVITDGGSSVYGADAIGGVVNFITRHSFDGVEFAARHGWGDSFSTTDAYVTVGRDWDSGSAYVSYNRAQQESIYARDRDYVRAIDWTTGVPLGRTCQPGNVSANSTNYRITSPTTLTPGVNACDLTSNTTIYPEEVRDTLFAGLDQDLNDSITFNIRAWYTNRESESDLGPYLASTTVAPGNPNYVSTGGANATASQTVSFDFSPVAGMHTISTTTMETWGVTPGVTADLGGDWQFRGFVNYGYSDTSVLVPLANATTLNGLVASGAINPYNIAASSPAAIASVLNWEQYGRGQDEIFNAKVVFDGPLITLPGGAVRAAIGAEFLSEDFEGVTGNTVRGGQAALQPGVADRDVNAFFGELNIPIVGETNRLPGIYELSLSLSARRDDYSDFGETTNPRIGLTYRPLEWITLRGQWGDSFEAPSLADLANATTSMVVLSSVPSIIVNPYVPAPGPGDYVVALQGSVTPLDPQEGKSYNVGFDISPPFIPGLEFGMSYYNIEYSGQISQPPISVPTDFYRNFGSDIFLMNPSAAQAQQFVSNAGATDLTPLSAIPSASQIYLVVDARRRNLGIVKVDGIDLMASYTHDTDWGSIYANFNGTYLLGSTSAVADGFPFSANRAGVGNSRSSYSATLGTTIGENFLAQATLRHVDSFSVTPTAANLNQSRVDDFEVVDLYFQYDVNGSGFAEDLQFSLSVNNVFDEDPPLFRGAYGGITFRADGYAGQTLGRVAQVGVSKRF